MKVELLRITPDAELLIEEAGRVCYDSAMGDAKKRIQGWIRAGHESMLEHAVATFKITASRVFTHEIVRHRTASFSQRSQRYVNETNAGFIIPDEVKSEDIKEWTNDYLDAFINYEKWLSKGYEKQIARYHLPNATESVIIMTANFRELRHIISLRTSPRAQPEMQQIIREVLRIMLKEAPSVFDDLGYLLK